MPQTKKPKTASKRKTVKKKPEATPQMTLFDVNNEPSQNPKMVAILVPEGTPMTFGTPKLSVEVENLTGIEGNPSLSQNFKTIIGLPKDQLREVINESGASAAEIIALCTTAHGLLYRLAAIGGKVTQRGKRK